MYGIAILIIMFLAMSCTNKPELRKVVVKNNKKFEYCMKEGKVEGQPLKILRKECKQYVERSALKDKAIKRCTEFKIEEIGWTTKEIDIYCNKLWRGYR